MRRRRFSAPVSGMSTRQVLEIAHTRNLYKSNLFRLQLEELLKELTPKATVKVEAALHSLKPLLLKMAPRELQVRNLLGYKWWCEL